MQPARGRFGRRFEVRASSLAAGRSPRFASRGSPAEPPAESRCRSG
jgi:hypothetical protein